MSEYYNHTTVPATSSSLSSATIRAEFDAVEAGTDKLPTLSGNGSKILAVNSGATALEAITTTGTGSGVRATSPTLVTPVLGVATATSINKVAFTAPATAATLTLADGSTLVTSGANSLTLTSTGATNVTLPTTGTLATLAGAEALTNKTYNGNTFTAGTGVLTIAAGKTATHNATTTFAGTDGKTLTVSNSLTLAGTDATVMTFPTTSATLARTDAANTFTGLQTFNGSINADAGTVAAPGIYLEAETGSGLYRIGANNIGVAISGAKVLDISATGLGVTGTLSSTGVVGLAGQAANSIVGVTTKSADSTSGTYSFIAYNSVSGDVLQVRGDGRVQIGLSSTLVVTTAAVAVTGTLSATGATTINSSSSRAVDGIRIGADSTNNLLDDASNGAGTQALFIGNAQITAVSDIRLKANIVDTQRDAINIFSKLRVVDHTWNDPSDQCDNNRNDRGVWTGLIAQEADEHIPWIVNRPRKPGHEDFMWQMDYNYMAPLFVRGFQQIDQRLKALENA